MQQVRHRCQVRPFAVQSQLSCRRLAPVAQPWRGGAGELLLQEVRHPIGEPSFAQQPRLSGQGLAPVEQAWPYRQRHLPVQEVRYRSLQRAHPLVVGLSARRFAPVEQAEPLICHSGDRFFTPLHNFCCAPPSNIIQYWGLGFAMCHNMACIFIVLLSCCKYTDFCECNQQNIIIFC